LVEEWTQDESGKLSFCIFDFDFSLFTSRNDVSLNICQSFIMPIRWPRRHRKGETSRPNLLQSILGRRKKDTKSSREQHAQPIESPVAKKASDNGDTDHGKEEQAKDSIDDKLKQEVPAAAEPPGHFVETVFSGAPQFSISLGDDGGVAAAVTFPWSTSLKVREATDFRPLEHGSFSLATARRHLVQGPPAKKAVLEYNIGVVEVPSMLSAQGQELGTVGFEYFLQDAVLQDSNQHSEETSISDTAFDALENHQLLRSSPEKLGIRTINFEFITQRLVELSELYRDFHSTSGKIHLLKKQSPGELYTLLFGTLLTPPKFDSSANDPTGLKVQTEALLRVLKRKSIWYDFSSVEWRIRLGQILWADNAKPDSLSDDEERSEDEGFADRDVLILQLALSCELLARLDSIAAVSAEEVMDDFRLSTDEIADFRKLETIKTRWDLVLARRFLRNIDVVAAKKETSVSVPLQQRARHFFSRSPEPEIKADAAQNHVNFLPRNLEQQLSGLFAFAKNISWPDASGFEEHLRSKLRIHEDALTLPSPSIYGTPLTSPRSARSYRNSYFDSRSQVGRKEMAPKRSMHLQPSTASQLDGESPDSTSTVASGTAASREIAHKALIGGWLTRTYMTGLILPGEPISHFLISALLENDAAAIADLGDSANLYGGFSYRGRSWWSKSCVIGRVMAAADGSKECMGWIAIPEAPLGVKAGWLDIYSELLEPPGPSRIRASEAVGNGGSFTAGEVVEDVKPANFMLPKDPDAYPKPNITFDGLHLKIQNIPLEDTIAPEPSRESSADQGILPPQSASVHFSLKDDPRSGPGIFVPLLYFVTFISAFPCFPPAGGNLQVFASDGGKAAELVGHPLHESQTYRIISAIDILSTPDLPSPALSPTVSPLSDSDAFLDARTSATSQPLAAPADQIIVIDARGSSALELLARAWCSWKGQHAIVARVGTTCLGCGIREAKMLGVKVVVRIAARGEGLPSRTWEHL
jgi:hypothetical protein